MRHFIRRHHISFLHAWDGIKWALTTQPNFKVHTALAAVALFLGFFLDISYVEMTILVLTIVFGLGVEMVNTSIEAMTDLITAEWKTQAKIAKDVSAGMMLVTAFGTILVGGLIFLPRIWQLIFSY